MPELFTPEGLATAVAICTIVQAVVVTVALIYAANQLRESRRSRDAAIALHLIEQLNLKESVERRHKVNRSIAPRIMEDRKKDHLVLVHVANEFHSLGYLIHRGIVDDEELVIDLYYNSILNTWRIMKPWIAAERVRRKNVYYAQYFEFLSQRALIFRDKHRPETVSP